MFKFLYFSLLLLGGINVLFSQTIHIDKNLQGRKQIESIILQEKSFGKDTVRLKSYLAPLLQSSDKKLHVVYYNLLATGISKAWDRVNISSDRYYKLSIETAKALHHPGLEIWALVNYGFYLYNYTKIAAALPVYMDADAKINKTDPSQMIFPSLCYKNLGFFFGTIGDRAEAVTYLKKAEQFAGSGYGDLAAIQDNIAFYLIGNSQFVEAEKYLSEAAHNALKIKDNERYAKILGNYGNLSFKKKNYSAAIDYYLKDIQYSRLAKAEKNTMFAQIQLSRALIMNNDISQARSNLAEAAKYARSKAYYMSFEKDIQELNLQIALKENNVPQELAARRRLSQLDDSLAHLDSQSNLDQSNLLAQKERYTSKLSLANAKYENEQLKTTAFIIIATILLILIMLIIFINKKQQKNRKIQYEKNVLKLQLDKLSSEQKLSDTHFTLEAMNTYLSEKNLQIERLNKEITRVHKQSDYSALEKQQQKLQRLLDSHLMTDENWLRFKRAFQKEQPDFYNQLIHNFPDLTESNIRIIILLKLGLINQEIASLLGITPEAVKKSKQRLRKKIGSEYDAIFYEI